MSRRPGARRSDGTSCHSAPDMRDGRKRPDMPQRGIPDNPDDKGDLKRALGPLHLISLGIGCIIGAGIFVLTGHAAAGYAGPGVVISFAIAGLGCLFAGLCYSEYASMIPVAGSAYTYTYATLGRFLAWIIGWNLVLEYLAASSTVAVGWSGYFNNFLSGQGMPVPAAFASAPLAGAWLRTTWWRPAPWINLPAVAAGRGSSPVCWSSG